MTNSKPVSRPAVGVAATLAIALGALVYIAVGNIGQNLVYYWTPSELLAAGDQALGATVRLGGMVRAGSIDWDRDSKILQFQVFDSDKEVAVRGSAMPPQMFRENIGVVVEGTMRSDGVFESDLLLVKHDNTYEAPHDGKDVDVEALYNSMQQ